MNDALAAAWLGAWGSILSGIAALMAVAVAGHQLKGLVKQLKQSNFTALLTLEIEMNARKQRVGEAARAVRFLSLKQDVDQNEIIIAYEFLEECLEDWFNLADRMAFCILNKYLRERDFKSEYRKYFEQFLIQYPEYFGPDTIYTNIVKLCHRWKIYHPNHFESVGYANAQKRQVS
jgi:hypothetical protein